jgi:hypothetical protein
MLSMRPSTCACTLSIEEKSIVGEGGDPRPSLQFEWESSDNDFDMSTNDELKGAPIQG